MTDVIRHRGPDGEGFFVDKSMAIGFRRLSILDLSEAADQPMWSQDGNFVIAFNGEIYNYIEIRNELLAKGVKFFSSSDTEVLLNAYICWGGACLERFNGMFSFVIYDVINRRIFGARDRFGVKPLHYYEDDSVILLASEIKSIMASGLVSKDINWKVAADFLVNGQLDTTDETFFAGVNRIPAATCFTINVVDGVMERSKYWALADQLDGEYSADELAHKYSDVFENSVALRLRSDVPVGVLLSGGIDSSSIICEMHSQLNVDQSLYAFSYTSDDFDESEYLNAVLEKTKPKIFYVESTPVDFIDSLSSLLWSHDEPVHSFTALVGYKLMEVASREGVKVVLGGQGADEVLAGYPNYFFHYWYSLLEARKFRLLNDQIMVFEKIYGSGRLSVVLSLFVAYVKNKMSEARAYREASIYYRKFKLSRSGCFKKDFVKCFLSPSCVSGKIDLDSVIRQSIGVSPLPIYLRVEDRNSMAHSVEGRLPFMDYRLVNLALSSSDEGKMLDGWSKRILRMAMAGKIPESVRLRRDKMGFPTPIDKWVSTDLYSMFYESLNDLSPHTRTAVDTSCLLSDLDRHKRGEVNLGARFFRVLQFDRWVRDNLCA